MALVETERHGGTIVIRLNRPERMNALGVEIRRELAQAFIGFENDETLEVAVLTGTGRAFCAGEDMKESLERGAPGFAERLPEDPFMTGKLKIKGDMSLAMKLQQVLG